MELDPIRLECVDDGRHPPRILVRQGGLADAYRGGQAAGVRTRQAIVRNIGELRLAGPPRIGLPAHARKKGGLRVRRLRQNGLRTETTEGVRLRSGWGRGETLFQIGDVA